MGKSKKEKTSSSTSSSSNDPPAAKTATRQLKEKAEAEEYDPTFAKCISCCLRSGSCFCGCSKWFCCKFIEYGLIFLLFVLALLLVWGFSMIVSSEAVSSSGGLVKDSILRRWNERKQA